ncbi:hypothetical protein [Microbacterium sp.]|uniref:hypothetical protein n=1 Tax=Microbacterium sp. TaxID=51671 RepID=UPI002628C372|nr:hypothetical protein [Microbacterium sp.]
MVRVIKTDEYAFPLPEEATVDQLLQHVRGDVTRSVLRAKLQGTGDVRLPMALADVLLDACAQYQRERTEGAS